MTPTLRVPPLLLLAVILHTAVFPQLRAFDVAPDVLLLLGITAGIAGGPERGAATGFACGLIADCFLQTPFGLSALAYSLVGWFVGSFQTRILHATWWIPVLTAAVATAGGIILFAVFGAVLGQDHLISLRVVPVVAVCALWSALLANPLVRLSRWALMIDPTRVGLVHR